MTTGLVLGGGGVIGHAYHAGVLAALEHDLGVDARAVDVVVGSSAGALTGLLLRLGLTGEDLAAWAVGAALDRPAARDLADAVGERPTFAPLTWRAMVGLPRVPGLPLLAAAARRPWRLRPLTGMLTLLTGDEELEPYVGFADRLLGGHWPTRPLWVTAVRRRDGHRVVLGREDAPVTTPGRAVAASCAVPGRFAPVRIGKDEYVDGGAHSPTNADVLRHAPPDLVVIVSPMSGRGSLGTGPEALVRNLCGRWLRHEVDVLTAAGAEVLVFEPGPAVRAAMGGLDLLSEVRVPDVVREAFLEAGETIADAPTRLTRRLAQVGRRVA